MAMQTSLILHCGIHFEGMRPDAGKCVIGDGPFETSKATVFDSILGGDSINGVRLGQFQPPAR